MLAGSGPLRLIGIWIVDHGGSLRSETLVLVSDVFDEIFQVRGLGLLIPCWVRFSFRYGSFLHLSVALDLLRMLLHVCAKGDPAPIDLMLFWQQIQQDGVILVMIP